MDGGDSGVGDGGGEVIDMRGRKLLVMGVGGEERMP